MRTGRYQCGGVCDESSGQTLGLYICHCRKCQKQSASAFGITLDVPHTGFCVIQGSPKYWARDRDSGGKLRCMKRGQTCSIAHDTEYDAA